MKLPSVTLMSRHALSKSSTPAAVRSVRLLIAFRIVTEICGVQEPKLVNARRIVAEWPALDQEAQDFTAQVLQLHSLTTFCRWRAGTAASGHAGLHSNRACLNIRGWVWGVSALRHCASSAANPIR